MLRVAGVVLWLSGIPAACLGQTTSAVLGGTVTDPGGSTVPEASVVLFSVDTGVYRSLTTSASGQFVFPLLPPGKYQLQIEARGFKLRVFSGLFLGAAQAARINAILQIAAEPQQIVVDDSNLLLNTMAPLDYTIRSGTLENMPMRGRNFLNLAGTAPGVTGRGSIDVFDNFDPEQDFDLSAHGRGSVGNTFLLDGLNVTSNITLGVTNLAPNPDSIEELSIQTDNFSVDQGRMSSLQIAMVTKGGSNQFHGTGSYFFTNQDLLARTVFTDQYEPFKRNNAAGTLGGPIVRNKAFFFSSMELLRSGIAAENSVQTFESPEFIEFAQKNFPNSLGTRVLTEAPLASVSNSKVAKRAIDVIPGECGTAASRYLPCDMPLILEGRYRLNPSRDGLQYSLRLDRYFRESRDRLYANYYRTALDVGTPAIRSGMSNTSAYGSHAVEASWTHTFSTSLILEASFSGIKVEGDNVPEARYHIPEINIAGQSTNISPGWGGAYAQHNYNWRSVVSWVRGSHMLKLGGGVYWSDDAADFTRSSTRPAFFFRNLLDLVRDQPQSESGAGYDPLTGVPAGLVFGGKISTSGLFVQDQWNVAPNLTIHMGVRWDHYGSPAGTKGLQLTNLAYGPGSTLDERIADARLIFNNQAYTQPLNRNFGFRGGVAWAPGGGRTWALRAGVGLYYDWISLGQSVDLLRQNPPNFIFPTFRTDGQIKPMFSLGTSDTYPFGFVLPTIPSSEFDSRGGLVGARPDIGFLSPEMTAPRMLTYLAGVERRFSEQMTAGLHYSGSRTGNALLGTDLNRVAGDLLDGSWDRLNPSFGSMSGVWNANAIQYDAMIATFRREFPGGSVQGSYTLSKTSDYVQAGTRQTRDSSYGIPDQHTIGASRADADWDARHRLSITGTWRIPQPAAVNRALRVLTTGWSMSAIAILQSGMPFTVINRNPFDPVIDASGRVVGLKPGSGDYNADGLNYDYPNTPAKDFSGTHSRQDFISGLFPADDFPAATPGTSGNLKRNSYRNPGLVNLDTSLIRNCPMPQLGEAGNLQLRIEFFNVLNRVNLLGVDNNLGSSTFGRSTAAYCPRMIQAGLRVVF